MNNPDFSKEVNELLAERPRWWVRTGNLFVLAFLAGVLFYLSQVKTTERRSYPVYLISRQGQAAYYKATGKTPGKQTGTYSLHFKKNAPETNEINVLPENAEITDSTILFSVTDEQPLKQDPQTVQEVGTLVYVNNDVSILSCFLNQLFR